jgi:hypothetical protein
VTIGADAYCPRSRVVCRPLQKPLDGLDLKSTVLAFSNFSGDLSHPKAISANIPAGSDLLDTQYNGFTYPSCLGTNDNLSFTQTFTVTVNGKQFPLSTVVSIGYGRFSGTYEDNVNITTP